VTGTDAQGNDSTRRGTFARVPFADLGSMTREIRGDVDDAWSRILETGRFIGGPEVERFESEWAAYCATTYAIGVANGTDALHLTLRALGIGPGDEVVVPTNTFVATAEAVVLAGATPRFADVDPTTLLITPATLEAAVTERTKAVMVVHLFGQMADMDGLAAAAESAGLVLIEDAAQAQGATWRSAPAGSVGRAGCFSFYPGKNLGAFGDAGAVVTSDSSLADAVTSMRDHGRRLGSHYDHDRLGTNSRLDAIQAAVLTAKLGRLDAWTKARRILVERYRDQLADSAVSLVAENPQGEGAYHLAVARVPHRDRVRDGLADVGIDTGVHYPIPCHRLDPYSRFATEPLPVAERAAGEIVSLPLFPHMAVEQVDRVCAELRRLVEDGQRSDVN
jgi:dTDP-4-amino-4,6-dideoxygalactose transaminase